MSGIAIRAKGFIGQLKQRGVFKVVSIYVVAAWGAVTGAVQLVPIVGAPTWVVEAVALLAAIGLPIATIVAWMFEATPEGLIRDRRDEELEGQASADVIGPHGVVKVTWRDAHAKARERTLNQPFSIGRDPTCAIRFEDPLVSRRHVEIGLADGVWYVADLGSRNGTMLDGIPIKREPLPKRRCTLRLSSQGPDIDLELRTSSAPTTLLAPQNNR